MDLASAIRAFRAAKSKSDACYLTLIEAHEKASKATTDYDRLETSAQRLKAETEYEAARQETREARRVWSNIMAGLAASG